MELDLPASSSSPLFGQTGLSLRIPNTLIQNSKYHLLYFT